MTTKEQIAIKNIRHTNNVAIKNKDATGVVAAYMDDFFILTSTNDFVRGKKAIQDVFHAVLHSKKPRADVNFVRTPSTIVVGDTAEEASEHGRWIGTWREGGHLIKVGGGYYAKWQKSGGHWKLRCEVYTQLESFSPES